MNFMSTLCLTLVLYEVIPFMRYLKPNDAYPECFAASKLVFWGKNQIKYKSDRAVFSREDVDLTVAKKPLKMANPCNSVITP